MCEPTGLLCKVTKLYKVAKLLCKVTKLYNIRKNNGLSTNPYWLCEGKILYISKFYNVVLVIIRYKKY